MAVAEVVVAVAVTEAVAVAVAVAVEDGTEVGCWGTLYGTDGASLRAGIASHVSGYTPPARNPPLLCSGINEAAHNWLIKPGK